MSWRVFIHISDLFALLLIFNIRLFIKEFFDIIHTLSHHFLKSCIILRLLIPITLTLNISNSSYWSTILNYWSLLYAISFLNDGFFILWEDWILCYVILAIYLCCVIQLVLCMILMISISIVWWWRNRTFLIIHLPFFFLMILFQSTFYFWLELFVWRLTEFFALCLCFNFFQIIKKVFWFIDWY